MPDQLRYRRGQYLKQSLRDDPQLDVAVIRCYLSPDAVAVGFRFAVEILVAADAP